jgi:hypothetical protein
MQTDLFWIDPIRLSVASILKIGKFSLDMVLKIMVF